MMWVVMILIAIAIFANYFLGYKLYKEPRKDEYFHNVRNINVIKTPEIAPDPQYILVLTFFMGLLIGLFIAVANKFHYGSIYGTVFTFIMGILYWIEISRRVKLTEDSLILSKALSKRIEIPLNDIQGMYIYSPNKKFMNGHAFTSKLVVCTRDKKIKFTISSLNKKAILNLMKNHFGVTEYKIFVANN